MKIEEKLKRIHSVILILLLSLFTVTSVSAEITVDSVYPPVGVVGQDLEVTITGIGFDENTRVLVYPSDDKSMIAGSVELNESIKDVIIEGDKAYITDNSGTFHIIDISIPSKPAVLGSVVMSDTAKIVTFTVAGDKAYVSDNEQTLHIIDLSILSNPVITSTVSVPEGDIRNILVKDDTIYADGDKLYVININDPSNPFILKTFEINPRSFTEIKEFLYVEIDNEEFQIIDISIPSEPKYVGEPINLEDHMLHVSNDTAYAVDNDNNLLVINVNDPKNPLITGHVKIPKMSDNDYLTDLIINNNFVYLVSRESGFYVIDVKIPSEPVIVKNLRLLWPTGKGIIIGNIAYITIYGWGITEIDISNPLNPSIIKILRISDMESNMGDKIYKSDNGNFYVLTENKLSAISLPNDIKPDLLSDQTGISVELNGVEQAGKYTIRIINGTESYELTDAVTFVDNRQNYWLTPTKFDFGMIKIGSESESHIFKFHNLSDSEINIESAFITGLNHSEFTIHNDLCSDNTIYPYGNCDIEVLFAPQSMGKKNAVLAVELQDSTSTKIETHLTGWAVNEGSYKYEAMWPVFQQPWYFSYPGQLAIDDDDLIYLLDKSNARVMKLSKNGQLITQWGRKGTDDGEFSVRHDLFDNNMNGPSDIAIDKAGNVYVVDSLNDRIQKFDSEGHFITKWGGKDDGRFNFSFPKSVSIDQNNKVWVADYHQGIHKFSSDGEHLNTWKSGQGDFPAEPHLIRISRSGIIHIISSNIEISRFTQDGILLNNWRGPIFSDSPYFGVEGSLTGMAIDENEDIFVAAPLVGYILHYNSKGNEIDKFEYYDGFNENLSACAAPDSGIILDKDDNLLFSHEWDDNIKKINKKGELLTIWGDLSDDLTIRNGEPYRIAIHQNNTLLVANRSKYPSINRYTEKGEHIEFKQLYTDDDLVIVEDISINRNGYIYALTYNTNGNHYIFKMDNNLDVNKYWEVGFQYFRGIDSDSNGNIYSAVGKSGIIKYSSEGDFISVYDDSALYILDIAIGNDDSIYALELKNGIFKFSPDFELIKQWGGEGISEGMFLNPVSISVDAFNRVFVADTYNDRVQIFTSEGDFIGIVGNGRGFQPGQLNRPTGVAVTPDGKYVYVVEEKNKRHQKFRFTSVPDNAKAIIVAGQKYDDDSLWNTTQMCANFAFRTLTYRGFTKETIQYLSPNTSLDLDGNGQPDDVDGESSSDNLQQAITQWAKDADSLVIYLTDHGGDGTFRMSATDILSATDLDLWLDQLQETMTGNVIVIYDACESGSFISSLTPPENKTRIVMTSTSPQEEAQFITQGTVSFSDYFWTHIFNGLDVGNAFSLAANAMKEPTEHQNAMIDADGDGITNEDEDMVIADKIFIGRGMKLQGDAPIIDRVSEDQIIFDTNSATLEAFGVTDEDEISRVWAVIRPPDYKPNSSGDPLQDLPSVDMIQREDNRYDAVYDKFHSPGIYKIAIYARDLMGNTCVPMLTTVTVENPLRRRAIIVAGGSENDDMWPAVAQSAKFACEALSFQGYSNEDIYLLSPVAITGVEKTPVPPILSNLEFALTIWADEKTQDVVVYIVGKGDDRIFHMNPDETLTPDQLNQWFNILQNNVSHIPVLIYDGCRSGSFLEALKPPENKKRIVLTSTGKDQPAYFLSQGNVSFSQYFWDKILNGNNVLNAYAATTKALTDGCKEQIPNIDDNGNGIANEKADGSLAKNFMIGAGILVAADEPIIGSVSPPAILDGQDNYLIQANDVTSTDTIQEVWAEIITPESRENFCDIKTIKIFLFESGTGQYERNVNGLSQEGVYDIAVYAMDSRGNISMPETTWVRQGKDSDIGNINGDSNVDLKDSIIALKVMAGMATDGLIRTDYKTGIADVNGDNKAGLEEAIYILQYIAQ
ncbi:Peptidase C13 domain-containing protein, LVIVD repeat-containing [Desulfonema limicola]|uniref:Peptidase C13 domain-containing protein, LVIVD repeat-containing n=1 Tax=Desulfonema limicola TaxID=45656 RepID=A0A975B4T5_9BACT|nr:C13 family peptidase [Desulfonema limicola]QTA78797.1 Peptidase C13 domain-containing protein, LVIVD repeat-containing [Desulfonema limicola]